MPELAERSSEWSGPEIDALVDDYFAMLDEEVVGAPYNKAKHNRELRETLLLRSRGAVEFKHCNVSAILDELGLRYLEGYKPRHNYQHLLKERVLARLQASRAGRYDR